MPTREITHMIHEKIILWWFYSLQNKIWDLPARSTILPKFLYDKEGKLAGLTQILPVRVCGPALILKTDFGQYITKFYGADILSIDVILSFPMINRKSTL